MAKPFANSGDPDQMPHSAASDLGLHCLPITLLGVSSLQWIKAKVFIDTGNLHVFHRKRISSLQIKSGEYNKKRRKFEIENLNISR